MSDSLWSHELQHARLPCPSPSPWACSSSCPLCQWWHPTISSSVATFLSCPESFPASRSFPMSQLFASGGQIIGGSASFLPINIHWFPFGLIGWICLQSKGLSRVFSRTTVQMHQSFGGQPTYSPAPTYIHDCWKNYSLDYVDICWQSLCFLICCLGFSYIFFPKSNCLLILWPQSPSAVILEENKICHCFYFVPISLPWSNRARCHDPSFLNVVF